MQSEAVALEHGPVRHEGTGRQAATPYYCVTRRQSQIASVHFLLSDERQESCVVPQRLSDGPPYCDRPVEVWLGGERGCVCVFVCVVGGVDDGARMHSQPTALLS